MNNSVCVVIATLGGEVLRETLASLSSGTHVPDEVLVCIPENEGLTEDYSDLSRIRIVRTPCRGQVAQRAYGLRLTGSCYVIQMDDDVRLPEDGVEQLFKACLELGRGNAVAPIFKNCETGAYLTSYRRDMKGFLQNAQASAIGRAPWGSRRMGRIDRAGIPYAVDPNYCADGEVVETEWLPGGCVICHREDLVVDNYYPFLGKAYSEDVIHSIIWRQRGVRLWVATAITCCTQVVAMPTSIEGVRADFRARAYVVSMDGGSLWRCRLWFALFICRQWLARLLRRNA